MSETDESTGEDDASELTEIRVKGHLAGRWADRFDGLTVTLTENGDTLLTGPVVDQAVLYGLLKKVRDLGLPLLTVNIIQKRRTK